jgi:hypothetical protein
MKKTKFARLSAVSASAVRLGSLKWFVFPPAVLDIYLYLEMDWVDFRWVSSDLCSLVGARSWSW